EFLLEALLRGDTATRGEYYNKAVLGGWMGRNEVRVRENLKPWPGLDEPQMAVNQAPSPNPGGNPRDAQPPAPSRRQPVRQRPVDEEGSAGRIALEAATRLVRKETAQIRKWAPRYASDQAGWKRWVAEFYDKYAGDLEAGLALEPALAREYCDGHQ